jgi:hypothetical protein
MPSMHTLTIQGRIHRLAQIPGGGGWMHHLDGWYTCHATARRAVHALREWARYDKWTSPDHVCIIGYNCCSKGCGVCGRDMHGTSWQQAVEVQVVASG